MEPFFLVFFKPIFFLIAASSNSDLIRRIRGTSRGSLAAVRWPQTRFKLLEIESDTERIKQIAARVDSKKKDPYIYTK